MQCTSTESPESFPVVAQGMLTYWPGLSTPEKAFVAAYVENSYSVSLAAAAIGIIPATGHKMLKNSNIRAAIAEVQTQIGSIDFLNEQWAKAQMLRLYPMVMGDEEVPLVTAAGEEIMARKFQPDIALRIVEYVAPKAQKSTVNINVSNVNKLTDEQLEKIAAQGLGRIVSEQ